MTDGTPAVDRPVRRVSRRGVLQAAGVTAASLVGSQALTERVMAQSGGPSNEISGTVVDANGAVENATVVAVPHDTSLSALETTTDANGDYVFQEADLHGGENLYHVIARDGSETSPRRGQENYPFIAATGPTIRSSEADAKLAHRWLLDDVNGTVEDSEGNADGTVNGVSSVAGSYAGGSAGQGDGTDGIITTGTLGSYGSDMSNGFAVAFSVDNVTTADQQSGVSVVNSGDSTWLGAGRLNAESAGNFGFRIRDQGNDDLHVTGSTDVTDGNAYRVVFNKTANSASGLEIWVNQSEETTTTHLDQDFSNPSNFDVDVPIFGRNNGGSLGLNFEGVIDDVCFFNDSLTQSEIQSYTNPWA